MEEKEFKLYVQIPVYFYFIIIVFLVISPLFFLIYTDNGVKIKILSIITLFLGIFMSLILFSINIFKKMGYIITKEGITAFSPVYEKTYLWNQIVSYTVNGYEKRNDLYLRFYTEDSLKNAGVLKPKYIINISTKYCRINISELIEKINKIRE